MWLWERIGRTIISMEKNVKLINNQMTRFNLIWDEMWLDLQIFGQSNYCQSKIMNCFSYSFNTRHNFNCLRVAKLLRNFSAEIKVMFGDFCWMVSCVRDPALLHFLGMRLSLGPDIAVDAFVTYWNWTVIHHLFSGLLFLGVQSAWNFASFWLSWKHLIISMVTVAR